MELKSAITSEYFSLLDTTPQFCDNLIDLYKEYGGNHDGSGEENSLSSDCFKDNYESELFSAEDDNDIVNLDNQLKLPTLIKALQTPIKTLQPEIVPKDEQDNNIVNLDNQLNLPTLIKTSQPEIVQKDVMVSKEEIVIKVEMVSKDELVSQDKIDPKTEIIVHSKFIDAGNLQSKKNTPIKYHAINKYLKLDKNGLNSALSNTQAVNKPIPSTKLNQPIPNDLIRPQTRKIRQNTLELPTDLKHFESSFYPPTNQRYSSQLAPLNFHCNPWTFPPKSFLPVNNKLSYHSSYSTFLQNVNRTMELSQNPPRNYYYVPVITKSKPVKQKHVTTCPNYVLCDSEELVPKRNVAKMVPMYCASTTSNMLKTVPGFFCYPSNAQTAKINTMQQNTAQFFGRKETKKLESLPTHTKVQCSKIYYPPIPPYTTSFSMRPEPSPLPKQEQIQVPFQNPNFVTPQCINRTSMSFPQNYDREMQSMYNASLLHNDHYFDNADGDDDIVTDFLASSHAHINASLNPASDNELKAIESLKEELLCEVSPISDTRSELNDNVYNTTNKAHPIELHSECLDQSSSLVLDNVGDDTAPCIYSSSNNGTNSTCMAPPQTTQVNSTPTYLNKTSHKEMLGLREAMLDLMEQSSSTDSDDYGLYHVRRRIMRENPKSKHNMKMRKRIFSTAIDTTIDVPNLNILTPFIKYTDSDSVDWDTSDNYLQSSPDKITDKKPVWKTSKRKKMLSFSKPAATVKQRKFLKFSEEAEDDIPHAQLKPKIQKQMSKTPKRKYTTKKLIKVTRPSVAVESNDDSISPQVPINNNELSIKIGETMKQINITDELCINCVKQDNTCTGCTKHLNSNNNNSSSNNNKNNNITTDNIVSDLSQSLVFPITKTRSTRLNQNDSLSYMQKTVNDEEMKKDSISIIENTSSPKSFPFFSPPRSEDSMEGKLTYADGSIKSPKYVGELSSKHGNKVKVIVKRRHPKAYGTRVRLGSDGTVQPKRSATVQNRTVDGAITDECKDFLHFIKTNKLLDTNVSCF